MNALTGPYELSSGGTDDRRSAEGAGPRPAPSKARARAGRAATASGYLLSPALLGGRRSGATIMQAPMQGTMQTAPGVMTMVRARVRVRVSGHGLAVRARERGSGQGAG